MTYNKDPKAEDSVHSKNYKRGNLKDDEVTGYWRMTGWYEDRNQLQITKTALISFNWLLFHDIHTTWIDRGGIA